jgi:uncharacterized protein (TIGR00251 family)
MFCPIRARFCQSPEIRAPLPARDFRARTTTPFLREQAGCLILAVKLQPRAAANEIVGVQGAELRVRVTAPPVDSAANAALLEFLTKRLDCARGQLRLLRGHTSRHKLIQITGLGTREVTQRLAIAAS